MRREKGSAHEREGSRGARDAGLIQAGTLPNLAIQSTAMKARELAVPAQDRY